MKLPLAVRHHAVLLVAWHYQLVLWWIPGRGEGVEGDPPSSCEGLSHGPWDRDEAVFGERGGGTGLERDRTK